MARFTREAPDLANLLKRFRGSPVCVVGDVIYDAYLEGSAGRLSREAPVPVVAVESRREAAGGAANVAVNLAALGARVGLYSCVGDDDAGACVLDIARRHGVDVGGVVVTDRRTTCSKRRVLSGGQIIARFDEGTEAGVGLDTEQRIARALAAGARDAGAVILSDYQAGVVTQRLIDVARRSGQPLIADGRDVRRFRRASPWACTPSFSETQPMLAGDGAWEADRAKLVIDSAARILGQTGAQVAVVTLDRDGAVVLERGHAPHRVYADPVQERCAAGAGDTFTAALTLALVAGAEAPAAAEIAAAAASVVVAKPGTATCSPGEVRLHLLPGGKVVPDARRLAAEGERHRREGRRIVFANGCFDILHRGHVALLNQAKTLGDVLVVGVNGDESVRRLKGPSRPVNALADRIEILAALSCVDHIVAFDADQPLDLIRALRPDLLVKGDDYTAETVPEAGLVGDLGGEVRILALVPGHSTTRVIERVRVGAGGGQ